MKQVCSVIALAMIMIGCSASWERSSNDTLKTVMAYNTRGIERYESGEVDEAISDFTKALELDPRDPGSYYHRGIARQRQGELDEAIADFTKALELDRRYAYIGYNNRGIARQRQGELDEAIADFTKALELDPGAAQAYSNRGAARSVKGEFDEAIADFTKALELGPHYAYTYHNLAWLLATSPQKDIRDGRRAVNYAHKACELTNWQNPNMLDALAAAYAAMGDFQGAIRWQNKALEFPEYRERQGEAGRQRLQLYLEGKPYIHSLTAP